MADGKNEEPVADLALTDIIDGTNEREIPAAKFIEDLDAFAETFDPPASAELLIGAYSELHTKYKNYEMRLSQKQSHLKQKIPEMEKSIALIQSLIQKRDQAETGMVRYSLADNIYAQAEVDYTADKVNLWLGANVMLEYTYDEALDFLTRNRDTTAWQLKDVSEDLAFVRDQCVTSEVNMSRIYNWNVRRQRAAKAKAAAS